MQEEIWISSLENETLKYVAKLKKKKYREAEKLFLAEGEKFLDYPKGVKYLILREDIFLEEEVLEKFSSANLLRLKKKCFQKISSQENPQGIILVYHFERKKLMQELTNHILVLEEIQDPGNLGTIFRLADAAGFQDVIVTDNCVDMYNEKVVRSSMGSIFHINLYSASGEEVIDFLKHKEYSCIVTSLEEDSVPYTEIQLEKRNAFIFGNEGHGVSREFLELAKQKVIIPISGKAESLNVAMALGLIIFYLRDSKKIFI